MLDRLSPLDAAFLDAEDEDPHASLAIASVAVLEGPVPTQEEIVAAITGKLPLVPRYRQKLRTVPFDLARPVWVDDPDFDIGYHVRRTALPAPGGERELCRLVGRVMSQRLDRDRPLWESWVVEGLSGGRWALLSKVHHCMIDGVGGVNLYNALFDHESEPRGAPGAAAPVGEPSTLWLATAAVRDLVLSPADQLRVLVRAAHHPARALRCLSDAVKGVAALVGSVVVQTTPSTLNGPLGRYRRYAAGHASLTDIARVARHFEVTINDVVLAAITAAFRALLLDRGQEPDPHVLRSLVPVSVRGREDTGVDHNHISLMLPYLPVDIAGPVQRLQAVHAQMARSKASKEAEAGNTVTSLARAAPFAPVSWAIRAGLHLPQRSVVTVTTNVRGPRERLYFLERPILDILPYVPIAIRLRTGVAVLSYCDRVAIGATADYRTATDADVLARAIEDGIAELVDAVKVKGGRRGSRSGSRGRVVA